MMQAAIARMTHNEPGPGQTYAIQARQAIAILRKQEPAIEIEINWCPAHKGIPGNEVADKWAKLAASERSRVADASRRYPTARATDIPSAPEAQGIGKEVAGGPNVVRTKEPQQRIRPSEERETGPDPS